MFDLIDHFVHQKKILKSLKDANLVIKIFFDIGAHKGKYTDLIIKNHRIKKAFLFEPQTEMFNYMRDKYKKNKSIYIFNYGISDKDEKRLFNINKHDLSSSIKKMNPNNRYLKFKSKLFGTNLQGMVEKKLQIRTIKLKNFFLKKNITKVDLVKIDTEGHEFEVLVGLQKKIKNVKAFLIEFHHGGTYMDYSGKKIEKILLKNGFFLKKKLKFPFTSWEDRLYINRN